jgi:molecular chaperone GrpE
MPSSPGTDQRQQADAELSAEERRAELNQIREQLAAAEDRYLRARADLENYRKRAERELERRAQEQADELVRAWLEVIDSTERALALDHENDPTLTEALRAFLAQMEAILARQGVTRIGEVGSAFDPELHEAIAVVPDSNAAPGTIAEIARSGYSAGDRVLRPAQVTVARPPADSG